MWRNALFAIGLSVAAGLLFFATHAIDQLRFTSVAAAVTLIAAAMATYFSMLRLKDDWMLGLSLICFTLSGCVAIDHVVFTQRSVATKSISVRANKNVVGKGTFSRSVVVVFVAFKDHQGKKQVATIYGFRGRNPVGKDASIPVSYFPTDPKNARVGGWLFWQWPAIIAGFSSFLLLLGGALAAWRRSKNGTWV